MELTAKLSDLLRKNGAELVGIGNEQDLCGKCFAVCAYTEQYMKTQIEKEA